MGKSLFRKAGVFVLVVNFLGMTFPPVSVAGLIGTGEAIAMQEQQAAERVDAFLARADVQEQMISLGVDPADAKARVAMLTQDELNQLAQELDGLPAGGDLLALIGAVFVVLLILELVGVINIFQKI